MNCYFYESHLLFHQFIVIVAFTYVLSGCTPYHNDYSAQAAPWAFLKTRSGSTFALLQSHFLLAVQPKTDMGK